MNALAHDTFVPATVDRKFWAIFGLSLVLHAALLFWSKNPLETAPPQLPTLIASLRPVTPPDNPPAVVKPPPKQVADARPIVSPQPPQPVQRRPLARQQLATQRPPAAVSVPVASIPPPAVIEPAPQPAPATPTPPAKATAQIVEVAAAPALPQVSLLAAYRRHLTEIFAGQQQYPRLAALRGWEGEVRLRLRVARKGNLVAFQLDQSSGFDVLDQHALAILEQLAKLPPLPEGLDASEIQVVVPINYKLKKTT